MRTERSPHYGCRMELRRYSDDDRQTCEGWFPPEGTDPFNMDSRWFEAATREALYAPDRHEVFVGWRDGERVTIIALSRGHGEPRRAGVSFLVSRVAQRQGVGKTAVQLLRDRLTDVDELTAWVDPDNDASVSLLKSLDFQRVSNAHGRDRYVWRRDGTPIPPDWQPPHTR